MQHALQFEGCCGPTFVCLSVYDQERSNSRKTKGKDEKRVRTPSFAREVKELTLLDSVDSDQVESRQEQVDPIVLEKYREKLYVEVSLVLSFHVSHSPVVVTFFQLLLFCAVSSSLLLSLA